MNICPACHQKIHSTEIDLMFESFWKIYPRKIGRKDAERAWKKIKDDPNAIIVALIKQKKAWQDPKFIPHASTWLNGERWNDEINLPTVRTPIKL